MHILNSVSYRNNIPAKILLEPDTKENLNKTLKTSETVLKNKKVIYFCSVIRLENCYILEMSTSKRKAYWVDRLSTYYGKRSAFIEHLSFFGTPVYINVDNST